MISILLSPLSFLYGLVTRIRNVAFEKGWFQSYRAELPVLSVGNISAGGNGKTPLCIFLYRELVSMGFEPVILTRGYGGSLSGPHQVTPDNLSVEVGDEALLMCKNHQLRVVLARDRVEGANWISKNRIGNLIILDDGFQHRRLKRNLDIVSVNVADDEAERAFCKAKLIPSGRFRENRDIALRRADCVVLSDRKPAHESKVISSQLLEVLPLSLPKFRCSVSSTHLKPLSGDSNIPRASKIIAFCAIANPESFFLTLTYLGFEIVARHTLPDHSSITESDLKKIRHLAPAVPLVCTEKDAVKLGQLDSHDIYVLTIEVEVSPKPEFLDLIRRKLNFAN